jgi:hypothetical protein
VEYVNVCDILIKSYDLAVWGVKVRQKQPNYKNGEPDEHLETFIFLRSGLLHCNLSEQLRLKHRIIPRGFSFKCYDFATAVILWESLKSRPRHYCSRIVLFPTKQVKANSRVLAIHTKEEI